MQQRQFWRRSDSLDEFEATMSGLLRPCRVQGRARTRYRTEILHGFTFATQAEIDQIIKSTSEDFPGTSYNLLTKNCNHFTQSLCERLTGRKGPSWLNRAAVR